MRHDTSRALFVAAAAAAVVVVLAGCAPATASPTSSPTGAAGKHTALPHYKSPALDITAPAAQISTPCSALITPQELIDWQGPGTSPVAPAAVAAGDLADPSMQLPVSDYVRAAGGLDCLWSAGPLDHYTLDSSSVPSYLEITVQFGAASEYAANAADIGADNGRAGECDSDSVGSICQLDDLVGTTWIEIYSRKAVGTGAGQDGIESIENSVLAAIGAAGTATGVPSTQAGTTALGTQCTDFVSAAAVQTALALAGTVAASTPSQVNTYGSALSTPIWFSSQDVEKNHPCVFSSGSTVEAQLSWIPGGAWAWNENKAQTLAEPPLQTLHVPGEQAGDTASIRCTASGSACTIDLVLGGNWIEATVPSSGTAANKRTAATRLAADIAGTVG